MSEQQNFNSNMIEKQKLTELQILIKNFCNENHLKTESYINLLDLLSELGEVSKEYLKKTKDGKNQFTPESDWENEIGDLFYSLIC